MGEYHGILNLTPSSAEDRLAPLSFEQERMWLLHQLVPGNAATHIRGAVEVSGPLDVALLEQSIAALIERHEILRTCFALVEGQPQQVIGPPWKLTLPVTDLRDRPAGEQDAEVRRLATRLVQQPFDLTQAPPWRVGLLQLSDCRQILVLCMHHIIGDGDWSLGLFFQETTTLYTALGTGRPSPLPALSLQYQDFARWQRTELTAAALLPQLDYWKQQLGENPVVLQLPTDRPRPALQTYAGASQAFTLAPPLVEKLTRLSRRAKVPLFVTLLAAFKALLYRYTGQADISVGVPTSGRYRPEWDGLIGYFGNPVVLRTEMAGECSFLALLARVQAIVEQAEANRHCPFQHLVTELNLAREMSVSPLFQVLFVMRNAAPRAWTQRLLPAFEMGGLTLTPLDVESDAVPYDWAVSVKETAQGLSWTWEYNTDLFDPATIGRLLGHCRQLLERVAANPEQPIGSLPLLTDAERDQLLKVWNRTQTDYPRLPIHRLVEDQVTRTPEAVAVLFENKPLTYWELNARANQLAHYLRRRGVGPEQLVGICLERSPELMIAILGTLKAGGAYLPLDPAYPSERLLYMLSDSTARVLLTTEARLKAIPRLAETDCETLCLEAVWPTQESTANPPTPLGVEHLAYVIYTSGSTGRPKGIAMEHRALANLINWHRRNRRVGPGVRMLQFSPIGFDISVHEIFATWCSGGTLVLVAEEVRRNPMALLDFIGEQGIEKLYLPFVALQQLATAAEGRPAPSRLREVMTAGEQLQITPAIARFFARTGAMLHNHYGGTEVQDVATFTLMGDPNQWPALPAIGRPIDNLQLYILDAFGQPVPTGVAGELYVGGEGLARGYLDPALTLEHFVPNPIAAGHLYKTGDRARYRPDGAIEHLGRLDQRVKIRGFRVELGEIEAVLAKHPAVCACAVKLDEAATGRLVAYIVPTSRAALPDLRRYLREALPDYMVPALLVTLERMPLTPSGKVDRRGLPAPETLQPAAVATQAMPASDIERQIAGVWQELLRTGPVDTGATFFELGGNSLLLVQAHQKLAPIFGDRLSLVTLFQYPTIQALAQQLTAPAHDETDRSEKRKALVKPHRRATESAMAIIGMACRFPGANTIEAFWQNLRDGVESITFFKDAELELEDPELWNYPDYVKAGSVLPDIDRFDATFFGYSAREAELTDPQQRLLLECAWDALENAGYNPSAYPGSVGVYIGTGISTYLINNVAPYLGFSSKRPFLESEAFQAKLGNDRNYYPTRLSYKLNLTGPSVAIQTACSTSLVTVHMACQSLLNGDCDIALAGGATIVVPQKVGYRYQEDMINSPDGHCRAFDAQAQGTLFGNGVGLVVLKGLDAAIADGDTIITVIKGSAMNNDGASKIGYTAPGVEGQTAVIARALASAAIDAGTVSYVETHGTATALGDPIELTALTQAFYLSTKQQTLPPKQCAIGSVKTNLGHLDEAAGIAGLIKTALALNHKQIPPSLHFHQANPKIDFDRTPFYVNTTLTEWQQSADGTPRRAGVSAFGMGGTNCHVVLEEAPPPAYPRTAVDRSRHLLTLSAKTPKVLQELAQRYIAYLAAEPDASLADIGFTANTGRRHFEHRLAVIAASPGELRQQLEQFVDSGQGARQAQPSTRTIAFLFTGQGAQYAGMGQTLYQTHPVFRETIERCAEILRPCLTEPLLAVMFPALNPGQADPALIQQTAYTQPALFALEYALAQVWLSWGIEPELLMGHSVGEYVAACVAGVFSLEEGLKLIAERGRLMQSLPPGGEMVAVVAEEAALVERLLPYRRQLSIAAVNGPQSTVIAGQGDVLRAVCAELEAAGLKTTRLAVSHAFHSPLMEPILPAFERVARRVRYAPPQRQLISNVTGEPATAAEVTTADYWCRHVRQAIRFADGMNSLHRRKVDTFVEIGPKPVLLAMGRQCRPDDDGLWLPSLSPNQDDWQQLLCSLGELYRYGVPIDWVGFERPYARRRVALPTYPFQRQRYWVQSQAKSHTPENWLYEALWQSQPRYGGIPDYLPAPATLQAPIERRCAELLASAGLVAYSQAQAQLEACSIAYVLNAFTTMGWSMQSGERFASAQKAAELGVARQHLPLLDRLLALLANAGFLHARGEYWEVRSCPAAQDPQTLIRSIDCPQAAAEVTLLARCGPQLPQVLRGTCDPIQVLFPAGDTATLAQYYRGAPILRIAHTLVQQAVLAALEQLPPGRGWRILELGAGTGGTTAYLLPHLPAQQTEYTFTDVSTFFIVKAQETYRDYPFVRYAILDLEQEPQTQGFEAGRYDLIVAADVLHATADLRRTLTHVRRLLAPNGLLVLMEDTAPLAWVDLTFGLTEGWWRFTDYDRRSSHPLLPPAGWQTLLAETGFADIAMTSIGEAKEPGLTLPREAVIIARAEATSAVDHSSDHKAGHWLILADAGEQFGKRLADWLHARNAPCTLAFAGAAFRAVSHDTFELDPASPTDFQRLLRTLPAVDSIVHCWSLDGQESDASPVCSETLRQAMLNSCGSTLHLVQTLLKEYAVAPRLWLVTRGAQAVDGQSVNQVMQAPLWGLGKSITLEHPQLHCVCLDLDPQATAEEVHTVGAEMFSSLPPERLEDQVGFRNQCRYVARLAQPQWRQPPAPTPLQLKPEGSYLITGGLGGLGLRVARFLVERGARYISLLGRSEPTPSACEQIRALEHAGARVAIRRADVADREQLAQALAAIESFAPPWRGIIHAAGSLDDGVIQQQSWARFENVIAPKVYGAWNLHLLTRHYPLDFFVLFSSSSALLGTAGQANHVAANTFLDALAWYRRRQGLPALSINWGPWSEIGATARRQLEERLQQRGEGSMTPEQGVHFLERLLLEQPVQVGVMPMDWPRFLQQVRSPFFAAFSAAPSLSATSEPESTFRQQLDAAPKEKRPALLAAHLESQVIQALGRNPAEPLEATLGLFELGMDSLTSIELRNRLSRSLNCALPVTLAFDYPTLAALLDYLSRKLFSTPPERQAEKPETPAAPAVHQLSEAQAEALLLQELAHLNF
ncbi:MAG: amino acid adenylation domain-containing protein [Candidatus Competibacteraceae bacterium]